MKQTPDTSNTNEVLQQGVAVDWDLLKPWLERLDPNLSIMRTGPANAVFSGRWTISHPDVTYALKIYVHTCEAGRARNQSLVLDYSEAPDWRGEPLGEKLGRDWDEKQVDWFFKNLHLMIGIEKGTRGLASQDLLLRLARAVQAFAEAHTQDDFQRYIPVLEIKTQMPKQLRLNETLSLPIAIHNIDFEDIDLQAGSNALRLLDFSPDEIRIEAVKNGDAWLQLSLLNKKTLLYGELQVWRFYLGVNPKEAARAVEATTILGTWTETTPSLRIISTGIPDEDRSLRNLCCIRIDENRMLLVHVRHPTFTQAPLNAVTRIENIFLIENAEISARYDEDFLNLHVHPSDSRGLSGFFKLDDKDWYFAPGLQPGDDRGDGLYPFYTALPNTTPQELALLSTLRSMGIECIVSNTDTDA